LLLPTCSFLFSSFLYLPLKIHDVRSKFQSYHFIYNYLNFYSYFFICNFHSWPFYQILFCFFGLWVHNCDLLFFKKLVLILLISIFCFGLSCEFNFSFQFHHSIQNSKLYSNLCFYFILGTHSLNWYFLFFILFIIDFFYCEFDCCFQFHHSNQNPKLSSQLFFISHLVFILLIAFFCYHFL
jgi:hypothetical protein